MAKPKKGSIVLLVGTRKGGFVFRSDARRRHWSVEGPHIVGQNIHHFILDPRDGETLFAATRSDWWGLDVHRIRDWGRSWHHTKGGVRYEKDADLSVKLSTVRPPVAALGRSRIAGCLRATHISRSCVRPGPLTWAIR